MIRNFCIIAHIDHGKSTLADRMLELTGVIERRDMRAQYLDRMDIERERGITIKAQAVRLPWTPRRVRARHEYTLNLIDTPGHVDFTYEVSRSLAACEGAVLLVDAAQGIEAQTLANLYLAVETGLHVIPVLNKIDLPAAQPDKFAAEIAPHHRLRPAGCAADQREDRRGRPGAAGKDRSRGRAPPAAGCAAARPRCFDCVYDIYRGCDHLRPGRRRDLTHPREVPDDVDGCGPRRARGRGDQPGTEDRPPPFRVGEVGYVIPGVKNVREARVGDTMTSAARAGRESLGGYRDPRPMVYSGLYPIDGDQYPLLRDALDRLQLNDASLIYEPETAAALGFGFRCGFLGLLHLEIVRERLEREFDLSLISTAPNVVYRVVMEDGDEVHVTNPADWVDGKIAEVYEPVVDAMMLLPSEYIGTVMELCQAAAARCAAWTTCPRTASS